MKCERIKPDGNQCQRVALKGSSFCRDHDHKSMYTFKFGEAQINRLKNHKEANTLEEEIAIVRLLLQSFMDKCESSADLVLHASRIQKLTDSISNLMVNSNRLQTKLNLLLSYDDLSLLINTIIQIVSGTIDRMDIDVKEREAALKAISLEIQKSIEETING